MRWDARSTGAEEGCGEKGDTIKKTSNGIYFLWYLVAILLKVHDGVWYFYVDRVDDQFDVERTKESIGYFHQGICQ